MALKKGFYVQEGLDVKVAGIFKAGSESMSSFFAGALHAGYVGVALATTAVPNKTARGRSPWPRLTANAQPSGVQIQNRIEVVFAKRLGPGPVVQVGMGTDQACNRGGISR